jgi:hypothetical protein
MSKYFRITLFLLISPSLLFSQKTVISKGSAQIEMSENLSRLEIKNKVRELATIDALERAFGRVVIQGNSTYISNLQTGKKIETNTVFNTIANTSVKGEVLEILDEEFTDITGTKTIDGRKEPVTEIRCNISIRAKEISTPPVNFTSYPLSCTDEKCRTTAFKDGDNMFMFFSSAVSGYISIFMDDRTETRCLLPYSTMPKEYEGGVPVSADKKYILFSDKPDFNYFTDKIYAPDTYSLYTDKIQEMNRIFVIFSPAPLNKPSLSEVKKIENNFQLPKSLKSEDFQRWLNSYRSLEKANVEVSIIDITITK